MASVIREIIIDAPAETVWAAVGDFAAGPAKTSPGFFTECRLEAPDLRALVFADGSVARERLIARDEAARRIVWGWVADDVAHDNTSMQVFAVSEGRSRLVWIHDTLSDRHADWLGSAMDALTPIFQQNLRAN